MAARRLLILMLVLLGISTLAAALLPTPGREEDGGEETAPSTTGEVGDEGRGPIGAETSPAGGDAEGAVAARPSRGKTLRARIDLGDKRIPVVPIKVGDNLSLEIRSKRRGLLEIPALGRVEAVAPGTSAFFDVRGREPASYGIRFLGRDRVVARIEVKRRRSKSRGRS